MLPEQAPAFLTAEWRHIPLLNYEVPAALLEPRLGPRLHECLGKNRNQGKSRIKLEATTLDHAGFMFPVTSQWT